MTYTDPTKASPNVNHLPLIPKKIHQVQVKKRFTMYMKTHTHNKSRKKAKLYTHRQEAKNKVYINASNLTKREVFFIYNNDCSRISLLLMVFITTI